MNGKAPVPPGEKPEDPHDARKRLTFEQAEGVEPLPNQLKLREVSKQLRSLLWLVFHHELDHATEQMDYGRPTIGEPWRTILFDMHVMRDHGMADEFDNSAKELIAQVKRTLTQGDYLKVFGSIQWVLRHRDCPDDFPEAIEQALQISKAAYTVIDQTTIVPISSKEEAQPFTKAFADVASVDFNGARAHLKEAGKSLTEGDYATSIRESIHAVDAVARVLEPKAKDLGPALAKLEKSVHIHGALKSGFLSLYGFTSDEKGIRHSLLDKNAAAVDETDALYMLGACAAFVSYLINRARAAGLLEPKKSAR